MGEEEGNGESEYIDNDMAKEAPVDLRKIRDHFEHGVEMLNSFIFDQESEVIHEESEYLNNKGFRRKVLYF